MAKHITTAQVTASKARIAAIASVAPKAPAAPAAAPSTTILKVLGQPAKPYRATSARGLYWATVQQFNGQPVAALAAHIAANPPSQPKVGKLAGQTGPPSGWLAYFKKQGCISIG